MTGVTTSDWSPLRELLWSGSGIKIDTSKVKLGSIIATSGPVVDYSAPKWMLQQISDKLDNLEASLTYLF